MRLIWGTSGTIIALVSPVSYANLSLRLYGRARNYRVASLPLRFSKQGEENHIHIKLEYTFSFLPNSFNVGLRKSANLVGISH